MNKVFYSLNDYLRKKYNEKVYKITIDAGFSCPNRDGTKGKGGCIYCNNDAFVNIDGNSIKDQVYNGIKRLRERGVKKYIVYFQSYSNTYGSLEEIKKRIEAALIDKNIVGIYIGTRPDVIDKDKLMYFSHLNRQYDIFIEYGLQSKHDKTLNYINRGHGLIDFENAFLLTKSIGLKVCAHIIFGLPCETKEMMLETVKYLAKLGIDAIKFHHLQIVENTKLAEIYKENPFSLLTENDYIKILAESLSLLPGDVIISRLVGSTRKDLLIAPKEWPNSTVDFLNKFETYMINNNIYQGKFYDACVY
jgi:radical SAM protein (TIGR01212 family)